MEIKNFFENLKSNLRLKHIFGHLTEKKLLSIAKYNKYLQKRMNMDINDYINYIRIEIELFPKLISKKNYFINIPEKERNYFRIYFNDEKKEIYRTYFTEKDKIKKIKIEIKYEVKSLAELFDECECIEKLNFIKCKTKNITNMNNMFSKCKSLKELNIDVLKTDNVTDMSFMFANCSSLIELNLNNFNTKNVNNMSGIFSGCNSLKKLYFKNFNTNNVTDISMMFYDCSSLSELDIDSFKNFNTDKVVNRKDFSKYCENGKITGKKPKYLTYTLSLYD